MAREKDTGLLTVATIRKAKDGEEILFNERQQIFTLGKNVKSPKEATGYLKDTIKKNTPVRAVLDPSSRRPQRRLDLMSAHPARCRP